VVPVGRTTGTRITLGGRGHMRKTVSLVALAAALLAACVSPPPLPPTLAGDPHFEGTQALTHLFCSTQGCVPDCQLFLQTVIDLYYERARILSRTYASGECLRSDWTSTTGTTTCVVLAGTQPPCGTRDLPVGPSYPPGGVFLEFAPIPGLGQLQTWFASMLHGVIVQVTGPSPPFRCSPALRQCKFQT
jgi:hypothetical protein